MENWDIEITDTFGGEANYCWARRFTVKAKSIRGAVNKFAREHGGGWRVHGRRLRSLQPDRRVHLHVRHI